jgi:phospholipase D1/2
LLHLIKRVDQSHRFRMLHTVTQGGQPIYVHAKILVVDDWLPAGRLFEPQQSLDGLRHRVRLAVEAPRGEAGGEIRRAIRPFRDDLLAEHLGAPSEEVAAAGKASNNSLIGHD